jgi:uncharacterized membrane protein
VCGRFCTKWVGLQVIAEKMKIYSYLHVAKYPYPKDISQMPEKFKCLYIIISLFWHPQNWRGARLLNIPLVLKQHLC